MQKDARRSPADAIAPSQPDKPIVQEVREDKREASSGQTGPVERSRNSVEARARRRTCRDPR